MKKSLMMAAGVSLFAVGLTTTALNNEVHAATKVTAGKNAKVTHSAYIYNSKGKRVKKASLKKNKTTKVIKIVKIKGKNYAQIGKNQFVKLGNLSGISGTKKSKKKVSKKLSKDDILRKNIDAWAKKYKSYDGIKVTAKKDTIMKVTNVLDDTMGYAMDEYEVKFPKGTSVYWDIANQGEFFEDDKNLYYSDEGLAVSEGKVDPAGNIDVVVNKDDVTFEKSNFVDDGYESEESLEDGNPIKDVDAVIPQTGSYKYQYVDDDDWLSLPNELKKKNLLRKATYGAVEAGYLSEKDYLAGKDWNDGSNH